jgi:hypothetical protein
MDPLRPDIGFVLVGLILVCVYVNRLTKSLSSDNAKLRALLAEIRDQLGK